jgi:hypothetical protein
MDEDSGTFEAAIDDTGEKLDKLIRVTEQNNLLCRQIKYILSYFILTSVTLITLRVRPPKDDGGYEYIGAVIVCVVCQAILHFSVRSR